MKKYEKIQVVSVEKKVKSIECDNCECEILKTDKDHYYEVTTSHNRWGNDSIDSIERLDLCSRWCLEANFNSYFDDADDTSKYEVERVNKRNYDE